MKKRVFSRMDNAVYRIVINTEDWSQGDIELMIQYEEPEVNVGGIVEYEYLEESRSKEFGDEFVRLVHGFPYARGFDSRDYESVEEAIAAGKAWKEMVLERIDDAVVDLRSKSEPLPTEEVSEM